MPRLGFGTVALWVVLLRNGTSTVQASVGVPGLRPRVFGRTYVQTLDLASTLAHRSPTLPESSSE